MIFIIKICQGTGVHRYKIRHECDIGYKNLERVHVGCVRPMWLVIIYRNCKISETVGVQFAAS
jgi:hypothetical protein